MYNRDEYKMTVDKNVFQPSMHRSFTPGFAYNVMLENGTSSHKLTSVTNKSLYDALDDGLRILLEMLARKDEVAMVRVSVKGLPFTEGGKQMLRDKYAAEIQFGNIYFD